MFSSIISVLPLVDDEDLEDVILCQLGQRKEPVPKQVKVFNLDNFSEEFCYLNFRFYKADLIRLNNLLRVPRIVRCLNRLRLSGVEAFCIMLRRLAYPNRYVDLMKIFPRTRCELSRIFNWMIAFMKRRHFHRITGFQALNLNDVMRLAQGIRAKGSPYTNCFGFCDGTVRPISRPGVRQKLYYNGHKRTHAIKFQSVMLPNGIIANMFGPVNGRRHDAFLLAESKILEELQARFYDPNGDPYFLYGDPAYPLRPHLIVPFKGQRLNHQKLMCNKRMSSVRECVEWGFGKIVQLFAFIDFEKNLKIGMQPVADYYKVAAFLTNCHTCFYGSQTSDYFNIEPPTINEYIH